MAENPTDPRVRSAIRGTIRDHAIQSPDADADAVADLLARAAANPELYAEADSDEHAATGGTEDAGADEHPDDEADQASAADIAAGKVVEPAEGGRVLPADG